MKNNRDGKYVALAALGFGILAAGFVLAISFPDAQGLMRTLPFIGIGIGAGIFGGNLGTTISHYLMKKDPLAARQAEIDTKDERNIAINDKAKAKAYDLMVIIYAALLFAFALMKVDLFVILSFVAAYLFITFSMIFYINKYHKEM
jgi:hypothetical protein